jgi:hypothetical protein
MREEWMFDAMPMGLFVRFANGRADSHHPIAVQSYVLTGVFFAMLLQPSQMLRPFFELFI